MTDDPKKAETPMESILYVEDEKHYGEIIKELHDCVQRKFYGQCRFDVVPSWSAAVERVAKDRPSVVILDLTLPPEKMKPAETLDEVKEVWKSWPPIVALTGNSFDLELRRKSILAGCDSFMLKTTNAELLCERIYNAFLRRLRDEGT